jgi:hypothetical protein
MQSRFLHAERRVAIRRGSLHRRVKSILYGRRPSTQQMKIAPRVMGHGERSRFLVDPHANRGALHAAKVRTWEARPPDTVVKQRTSGFEAR